MNTPPPDERPISPPAHPAPDEAEQPGTHANWAMVVVFGLIGAIVVVILVLHLTGVVGPVSHG